MTEAITILYIHSLKQVISDHLKYSTVMHVCNPRLTRIPPD